MVEGSGFGVQGLGFRVWGFGLRVHLGGLGELADVVAHLLVRHHFQVVLRGGPHDLFQRFGLSISEFSI